MIIKVLVEVRLSIDCPLLMKWRGDSHATLPTPTRLSFADAVHHHSSLHLASTDKHAGPHPPTDDTSGFELRADQEFA